MANSREKACTGKARHTSEKNALIAKRNGGYEYWETWPYRCKYCHFWHLGHQSDFKPRPKKQPKERTKWWCEFKRR